MVYPEHVEGLVTTKSPLIVLFEKYLGDVINTISNKESRKNINGIVQMSGQYRHA